MEMTNFIKLFIWFQFGIKSDPNIVKPTSDQDLRRRVVQEYNNEIIEMKNWWNHGFPNILEDSFQHKHIGHISGF